MPGVLHRQDFGAIRFATPALTVTLGCLGSSRERITCGGQRRANPLVSKENSGFALGFAVSDSQGAHAVDRYPDRATRVGVSCLWDHHGDRQ